MDRMKEIIRQREAMKRSAWIDNVKRILSYSTEQAEQAYNRIFNRG